MNAWTFLFPSSARAERHRKVEVEIEKLSAARRDMVQVAQSQSRVMATLAGAMQLMAQKASNDAP